MKNHPIILLVIGLAFVCSAITFEGERTPANFESDLDSYVDEFELVLLDQEKCKEVQKKLRVLFKEVNGYFFEHPEEQEKYKVLIHDVRAFKSYVSTLTNSSANLLELSDFKAGCRLIGGSFTYLEKGEYCVDVIKHRVGGHLCYLAFNTDFDQAKSYKITYVIDAPSLNKRGVLNSIVLAGKIDLITDNRDWTDERFLKISSIECTETEW